MGQHQPSTLIRDDPHWLYLGFWGRIQTRRLRVWREDGGGMVAAVTERATDTGTSITNAAENVITQLIEEHGPDIEVIEHYAPRPRDTSGDEAGDVWSLTTMDEGGVTRVELPAGPVAWPATYNLVTIGARGGAVWAPVRPDEVVRRLGTDLND